MLHAYKSIYKNQCLPRLYLPRKEGGLGLLQIDATHRSAIAQIAERIKHNTDPISLAIVAHENRKPPTNSLTLKSRDYMANAGITPCPEELSQEQRARKTKYQFKQNTREKMKKAWRDHACSGPYIRDILEKEIISQEATNEYLVRGFHRPEDERMIVAAQDQALRTRWFQKNIEKSITSEMCRLCEERPETVSHILAGCQTLLQRGAYTERHNAICRLLHYRLCQKYGIPTTSPKYWLHSPQTVIENEKATITYDYEIPTSISVPRCRPDIIVKDKTAKMSYIIEVGVPGDIGTAAYEREKELKYQRLKYEIRPLWGTEMTLIPVIVGATGAIKKINLETP